MSVKRTDPALVTGLKTTLVLTHMYRSQTFYGPKIPTRNMIQYAGRWRRVYVVNYANAGSAYIVCKGENLYLDIDTEYALSEGLSSERLAI